MSPGVADPARSLLLTVLGEFVAPTGGPVWTGALVAALGALGVQEKSARQALTRSAADGWLVGERVGRRVRYGLSADTRDLLSQGAQRIYGFGDGRGGWDGRWLVLLVSVPEESRPARHRLRTGLAWAGFGPLGGGVWVSPDTGREDEARKLLDALGSAVSVSSFVGHHGSLGDEAVLVARAWDLPELEQRYEAFRRAFAARRPAIGAEVFADQTRLVHEWRRFPLLDPGLPDALLPLTWPGRPALELFERRHQEWAPAAEAWFAANGA